MTNEQFKALVFRLEEEARRNPSRYQLRVLLLALLGNTYLAAVVALIVVLFAAALFSITVLKVYGIKLAAVIGLFLLVILRALWVRTSWPKGQEIIDREAPELFTMIGDLRRVLGAPRFHHVLVTNDFNAAVVQLPDLGIFGWHRNFLLIGLPLMKSLTCEQFKAVLAHEFGHLAKGHGRLSNWIYRQRLRWSQLMAVLEGNDNKGSLLFRPFLNWYAPYFNAYSFPLARANEYEADATAARLTSPSVAAEALTSVNVIGSYLSERYWPQIHRQADNLPQPSIAPFVNMELRVAAELDEVSSQGWLQQALARETTLADTHPALVDRLKAIGESPRFIPVTPGQTADRLLGTALPEVSDALDHSWQKGILPAWEQRHRQVQEGRHRLAELDTQHASGIELSLRDSYERARLTESIGNNADAALEQLRSLHERAPDNATVCFSFGIQLLARDDDHGCVLVERAMRLEEDAVLQGCQELRDYFWRRGKKEEADAWHRRLLERAQLQQAAEKERSLILVTDRFEPHGLPDETLAALRTQLQAMPGLRKAYLVRKNVTYLPNRACYVLGFSVTGRFQLYSRRLAGEVQRRILENVRLPNQTRVISVEGDNSRFGRRFRSMQGARVL